MKYLFFLAVMLLPILIWAQQWAPVTADSTRQQCVATTIANAQCKLAALKDGTNKCYIHSELTPRCGAETKNKTPCRRTVKTAGNKCTQHQNKQREK